MIFFVRHYLHRGKVHTISVKTTNTLSLQRHQQDQRRASHQSVCPFFLLFVFPSLLSFSFPFWSCICQGFFCFRIASPILLYFYFLLFVLRVSPFQCEVHCSTEFSSRFLLPILCLLFNVCVRHESRPNRSTIGRPPYRRWEKRAKIIYIQIFCRFLPFFFTRSNRANIEVKQAKGHTVQHSHKLGDFLLAVLSHISTSYACR